MCILNVHALCICSMNLSFGSFQESVVQDLAMKRIVPPCCFIFNKTTPKVLEALFLIVLSSEILKA